MATHWEQTRGKEEAEEAPDEEEEEVFPRQEGKGHDKPPPAHLKEALLT